MLIIKNIILTSMLSLFISQSFAETCCSNMGGINYCDSSSGRLVCQNGFYSACYCTRHSVMDLQLLKGCCLWKGGVSPNYSRGPDVLCNDGTVSEECSIAYSQKPSGIY